MGTDTMGSVRDMAEQHVSMPAWALSLALTVIPLSINGLIYLVGEHGSNSLLEQRMTEMEHRATTTDAKLEVIGSHLADLSTNMAVLVERTGSQHPPPFGAQH